MSTNDKSNTMRNPIGKAFRGKSRSATEHGAAASSREPLEFHGPAVVVSRRAADRLRAGHVWVYQSDIEQIVPPDEGSSLVTVLDARGIALGTATYSPSSQIALRRLSDDLIDDAQWLHILQDRLRDAVRLRKELLAAENGRTNACRLVFSEADEIPGLIADQYEDLVIVQLLTRGMATAPIRDAVVEVLREELNPAAILERPDTRIRELEQIEDEVSGPLYLREGANAEAARIFRLNGLRFHFDAGTGQKTGAFLDQRENYLAAARYAHGEALDVCTYQGGFAMHLARWCPRVTGVDISRAALEVAEKNLELNRSEVGEAEVDWIEANAFDLLKDWSTAGPAYDTIILDPPAFAKTRRAAESALRGYKELNLRAMKMLRPDGILVTCSCSHHVSLSEFTAVVAAAAADARRRATLIERRGAAADHPAILTIPKTEYLKCLICRIA